MYLLYLFAWKVIGILPEKTAYQLANFVSDQILRKNGKGIQRLRSNYKRVVPSISNSALEALTKEGMRSYLRYWFDTFRLNKWSKERIIQTTKVNNEHLLRDPIEKKIGCIVALPHAGNWDHAGAYFCGKGINLVTVAEHLKPEKLFLKFLSYRQAMGMEVLPLDGRVLGTLEQRLRQGALVALIADRDLSRSGIAVTFFGAPSRMPPGPAILALKTDAPLITAFVSYTETGIHIDFNEVSLPTSGSDEEKISHIVQKMAQQFEDGIADHPEDWHMLQRIWTDGDFRERV